MKENEKSDEIKIEGSSNSNTNDSLTQNTNTTETTQQQQPILLQNETTTNQEKEINDDENQNPPTISSSINNNNNHISNNDNNTTLTPPIDLNMIIPTTPLRKFNFSIPTLSFTEQQILRCKIFHDLWSKGFYLTSASKFGGDFLAYPGDPMRFHAHYVIIGIEFFLFFIFYLCY